MGRDYRLGRVGRVAAVLGAITVLAGIVIYDGRVEEAGLYRYVDDSKKEIVRVEAGDRSRLKRVEISDGRRSYDVLDDFRGFEDAKKIFWSRNTKKLEEKGLDISRKLRLIVEDGRKNYVEVDERNYPKPKKKKFLEKLFYAFYYNFPALDL